jgi:hypothetical protein
MIAAITIVTTIIMIQTIMITIITNPDFEPLINTDRR